MAGNSHQKEKSMKRGNLPQLLPILIFIFLFACSGRGEFPVEDIKAPHLYQGTFSASPNPAYLNDTVLFQVGFKDFDGDTKRPMLALNLTDEEGNTQAISVEDFSIVGTKAGVISFSLLAGADSQGTYSLKISDDAGNISNAVLIQLFVNPIPRPEKDDDHETNDNSPDDDSSFDDDSGV